jgi:hypothetical protein
MNERQKYALKVIMEMEKDDAIEFILYTLKRDLTASRLSVLHNTASNYDRLVFFIEELINEAIIDTQTHYARNRS